MSSSDINQIGRTSDFAKPMSQQFLLPPCIVYYMSQNPSTPGVYEKLIRTCKYFYSKNPIIVVNKIEICEDYFYISKYCGRSKAYPITLNLNQILCKFWVTEEVFVAGSLNFAIDILREKMFQIYALKCSELHVPIKTISSIKAVKLVKKMVCFFSVPEYADGTLMSVEKVFESFPNLEVFEFFV